VIAPAAPPSSPATKFGRALRLRCPRCGGGDIRRTWFTMRASCLTCGLAFDRGETSDFWLGAYVFNFAIGELLGIGIPGAMVIATAPRQPWTLIEVVAVLLVIGLPMLFFPFSRTLWLAWDLSFRPIEPGDASGGASQRG
jgi:uncharacterized protein (DUF983 family)